MMSYILIGAGIWFLIWMFGGNSGGSSSTRPVTRQVVVKSEQPIAPLPDPKPTTLPALLSAATGKMHEESIIYRDDTSFDLSYCGWFRNFKILVDARLKLAKFRIDEQEDFEKDPKLRAMYEQLAGRVMPESW